MTVSQNLNMTIFCSHFPSCLSVLPSVVALGTLLVLGMQLMQTSKLLKEQAKPLTIPGEF
jgi:hypothetical protein